MEGVFIKKVLTTSAAFLTLNLKEKGDE